MKKLSWSKISFLKGARFWLMLMVVTFAFQPSLIVYKSHFFSGLLNSFTIFSLSWFDLNFLFLILFLGLAFWFEKSDDFFTRFRWKVSHDWFGVLFWLFLLTMLISTFFGADKILSILGLLRWVELLTVFLLLQNNLISRDQVVKLLLYVLAFEGILAVFQFAFHSSLGLNWLGEQNVNQEMLNVAKIDLGGEKWLRAYGTFSHPNILAAFGVMGLALVVRQTLFKRKKLIYFLPVLLILLFAFSRSAWLAALVFIVALIALGEFEINWKFLLGGVSAVLLLLLIFNLGDLVLVRLSAWNDQAWQERIQLFDLANLIIRTQSWGVGLGNYVLALSSFVPLNFSYWLYQPVHSLYFLVLAELGIQGLAVFLGMFLVLFKSLLQFTVQTKHPYSKESKVFFSLLTSFLILGLFDHYFFTNLGGQFLLVIAWYLADVGVEEKLSVSV